MCRYSAVPPEPEAMLSKCEELLDLLYANRDHAKLRSLIADIEDLRDRILSSSEKPTCRRFAVPYPAGAEGLEPPTPGFGDRCSTN